MPRNGAIAVVGASESTLWTYWLLHNLEEYHYPGEIWPVNPRRDTVYGRSCVPSVAALPGVADTAVLITSPDRAVAACTELVAAGTTRLLVVSDGFRETATDDGIAREQALVDLVRGAKGVELVGPNCVGYASLHDSVCAIAEPIPTGLEAGSVSVISQSGVLTHTALAALAEEGLGVDQCYSIGNGATFGFEQALAALASRETTRTICAAVESIRDREALAAVVQAGHDRGVEFVFLLLGQSEDGARVARSHTGAVVGDQRIVRAWLASLGVVLVESFEELTRTAALLGTVGRPSATHGVFILTNSGGGAGLAADTCTAKGLPLARLSDETSRAVSELVLPGTVVGNPLDITNHSEPDGTRRIYDLVAADPAVGIMIDPYGLSWPDDSDARRWHRAGMDSLAEAAAAARVGLIYTSLMGQPATNYVRRLANKPDLAVNVGLATTISSLAKLYTRSTKSAEEPPSAPRLHVDDTVIDEARARDVLGGLGLPVVTGVLAASPEQAEKLSQDLRAPWVAKIALDGLAHKGNVGGVRLGLCTPPDLRAACEDIVSRVVEQGLGSLEDVGFMVQEMDFGPELLVGLMRDAAAGPAVVIGVGGWSAEAGMVFATVPLPASRRVLELALDDSPLAHLVGSGSRAGLVDLLTCLTEHFVTGALSDYDVVELNPIILSARGPRIADAMLIRSTELTTF